MKTIVALLGFLLMAGCTTVTIDPVSSWEGHYYTESEVQAAIENMKLNKNQSVWILSDSTLMRVLKNNRKAK